ncbi:transmembrane and TPR repeat-containing protein CG4050-like [Limulus polyphemus]|uniref:dolichyl-phosphate-mannose--protein mannosyltransferase n=1 Tax=Limulus polyphemus TaxID=6850 RepID=A0ABM1B1L1_LIMPO|nr:transmembrane and TPR repeat-containing protein CG4050-like [Limulus polyphemus]
MAPRLSTRSPPKRLREDMDSKVKTEHYILVSLAACVCYLNSLQCGFVFDDMSAIRDNRDLRPQTPITNLFWNDFWGTPIHKVHLNQRVCRMILPELASLVAAVFFAVHPIHTEAVTGVVGRAETLSSVLFLLAFIAYTKCMTGKGRNTEWPPFLESIFLMTIATLCKEQGITVVGLCCTYEVFVAQKLRLPDLLRIFQNLMTSKSPPPPWLREAVIRLVILVGSALLLLVGRVKVMGAQLPVFTKFDNPAAVAETPARQLTYNYLLPVNAWLMLFPCDLCCDWTMGTIPLVESFTDPRNLFSVVFYLFFVLLVWNALNSDDDHSEVVVMSLSFVVFPFLPASNLFFPVGFVVAERVLYTPSMGFCMLVAYGWYLLLEKTHWKSFFWGLLVFLLLTHSFKTVTRNFDWESEYTIFMAGLRVNHQNAKLYNNVGHALEGQEKFHEALQYFIKASRAQPDDIGAHINVGRTFNNLQQYDEAEQAFWKAKDLLPRPRAGEPYKARIAPNHLNVFLNLANVISRNKSRLEEADALYRQAISMRADYIQAYINRGDILIKLNRTQEAQDVYERALQFDSNNPDIYYNLGVVYLEQGKATQALVYFNKALTLEPEHERLQLLLRKRKVNERVYFNLGMLSMDDKRFREAETWFKKAVEVREDFRSALFNLALLLSDTHRPLEAVPFLKQLLKYHSDHVKGLILLGDIYINHVRDLDAAEECYKRILDMEPTNVQAVHNLCVVHVERGHLQKGEQCLVQAAELAPKEEYIQRHLQIIRSRLQTIRAKTSTQVQQEKSAHSIHQTKGQRNSNYMAKSESAFKRQSSRSSQVDTSPLNEQKSTRKEK